MGLADLNQLIEHGIEEVLALFLQRCAQPAPVPGQAIGAFRSKGTHHIGMVLGNPTLERVFIDLEMTLQANGVIADSKHLFRTVQ